ncbi:MAG: hypothetical protein JKY98_05805 [Gammaproteobacteria bacterium]|nr:hypothetical protein [Gammaproteobacteria bacterium]
MVRKAAVFLSTLLMLVATQVYAVGLGTVTLDSALNQPLNARVEIHDLGNVDPQEIIVGLASPEDFERFNVDRSGFLLGLRFEVETTTAGVFVNLTTRQPVREPFLSFILDTRWSTGRILSEHTLLLDLPVFDDRPAQSLAQPITSVAKPDTEPVQGVVQRQPVVDRTPDPIPSTPDVPATPDSDPEPEEVQQVSAVEEIEPAAFEEQVTSTSQAKDTDVAPIPNTVEVQESDTLWEVALRVRPDSSVSVQQTMMAIQRLNPDAFINGNINLLRSGEVLRIPDLSDIETVDQVQAVSDVVRQNQQANIGIEPLAAPATGPNGGAAGQQGQLSVLTAEDTEPTDSGAGSQLADENAELDSRIQALENRLAIQEEETDRARLQQEALIARLDDLDVQISSALEIITLQDQQLAQLQDSLATAAEQAVQAEVVAEPESEPVAEEQAQPATVLDNILDVLGSNSMILIIVIIMVVVLLVSLLLRRSKVSKDGFEEELDEPAEMDELANDEEVIAAVEQAEETNRFTQLLDIEEPEDSPLTETLTSKVEIDLGLGEEHSVEAFDEAEEDLSKDDKTEIEEPLDSALKPEEELEELQENIEEASEELEEPSEETEASDDIDFDLDDLIDEAGVEIAMEDAVVAEDMDFNLTDFEDEEVDGESDNESDIEVAEETEDSEPEADTEISAEIEEFDDDVDVMFDLADSEEESIQADEEETLEFSVATDESSDEGDATSDDEVTGRDTESAIESVNFDVTDITELEGFTEQTEEGEEPDTGESVDFNLEFEAEEAADVESPYEPGEVIDFELDEVEEISDADTSEEDTEIVNFEDTAIEEPDTSIEVEAEENTEIESIEETAQAEADTVVEVVEDFSEQDEPHIDDIEDIAIEELDTEAESDIDIADDDDTGFEAEVFDESGLENLVDGDTSIEEAEEIELTAEELDISPEADENTEIESAEEAIQAKADKASEPEEVENITDQDEPEIEEIDIEELDAAAEMDIDSAMDDGTEFEVEVFDEGGPGFVDDDTTLEEAEEIVLNDEEPDAIEKIYENDVTATPGTASKADNELDYLEFLAADADLVTEGTEEEFDFLSDDDEAATKLDLAYAYQKMGDVDGAREILEEVVTEGNKAQATEAKSLLETLEE